MLFNYYLLLWNIIIIKNGYFFSQCPFSNFMWSEVYCGSVVSDSLQPHGLKHARLPCPSLSPGVCTNSYPLSRCHPTVSPSVSPFSSCPQCFPASGNESALHIRSGQSIGASASVLPVNQDWFPLELTGLISLQSKGLSSVLSSTTIQRHQFFGAQPSLWSNGYMLWMCIFYLLMSTYDVLCP